MKALSNGTDWLFLRSPVLLRTPSTCFSVGDSVVFFTWNSSEGDFEAGVMVITNQYLIVFSTLKILLEFCFVLLQNEDCERAGVLRKKVVTMLGHRHNQMKLCRFCQVEEDFCRSSD